MIEVHSSAFTDGGRLPLRFAARGIGGRDASPPLSWTGIPQGTASLAVTCVDHHPVAREFLHWLVVDLPADLPFLAEGASLSAMIPAGARELLGTAGRIGYVGPRPPQDPARTPMSSPCGRSTRARSR